MAIEVPDDIEHVICGCPAPVHSPAIVHRNGGISADVLNSCGHCGEYIVKANGVWVAIPPSERARLVPEFPAQQRGKQ